jgi:GNAT superfamily N-acetyltransferase
MTDSMFGAVSHRRRFAISETRDLAELLQILDGDRLFAAYALAQLEPDAFPHSRWWTAQSELGLSLICHSRAGLGDATFALGPAEGVAAILSLHPGQFQTFATAKPAHIEALEESHVLTGARQMQRMHVTAESFRPVEPVEADGPPTIFRLRGYQVQTLNRLYSAEGGPTSYRAHHVEEGCYFGVVEEGRLVAVAGTHSISPSTGVAVVGNVFTHPQHRGQGHATLATSATTAELLRSCRDVVLSVDPANKPAVSAYETLGYVKRGEIVEAAARRRSGGFSLGLRRLLASLRGRAQGVELVNR